jgi:hypothetical protein
MEKKRPMKKRWVLDQAVRHTIEETWAVFTNWTITPNPALFLARLADLARSNAFLWTEAGFQMQEHATRGPIYFRPFMSARWPPCKTACRRAPGRR